MPIGLQELVNATAQQILRETKSGARIEYIMGYVASVDLENHLCDIYPDGNTAESSQDFRIPIGWTVRVGDYVRCGIDYGSNLGKWVDELMPLGTSDNVDSPTTACGRSVNLLPSGFDSDLSLGVGAVGAVYVHDGNNKLAKFRPDLALLWNKTADGGSHVVFHQAGDEVPVIIGDKAYLRATGGVAWDKSANYQAVAAEPQDRPKFWVSHGEGGNVYSSSGPAYGNGTHTLSNDHIFPWTSEEGVLFGENAFEDQRFAIWHGHIPANADPGDYSLDIDISVYEIDTNDIYCVSTNAHAIEAQGSVTPNDGVTFGPTGCYWPYGTTFPANQDGPHNVNATYDGDDVLSNGNEVRSYDRHITVYVRVTSATVTQMNITGTITASGFMSSSDNALDTRNSSDGTLVTSASLGAEGTELRASTSGQFVYVRQGTDLIEFWDRTPAQTGSVTIADFFPCGDWAVDDAGSIYRLDTNGTLDKYGSGGSLLWSRDLDSLQSYTFPSDGITLANGTGQQIIVDDLVRIVGYVGNADWTVQSEAALITLTKAGGEIKAVQRFGGDSDDSAMALAVTRTLEGCIFIAGIAEGTEFENLTLAGGTNGWIVRVGDTDLIDPGSDEAPASDAALTAHVDDTDDAHNASAISFTPAGSIAATDVQAAIEEVLAEAGGGHTEDHDHDGSPTQKLAQANTHESPDTDSAPTALHHTLGTGANQAAAGSHSHGGAGGGDWDGVATVTGSDVSNSTTTLANITGLSFTADSGGLYVWEAHLMGITTDASDFKFSAGEDATVRGVLNLLNYDATSLGGVTDPGSTNKAWISGVAIGGTGAIRPYSMYGNHYGNGGTFVVQHACAAGTGPAVIKIGSILRWKKLN